MYRNLFLAMCELLIDEFLTKVFIYRKTQRKIFQVKAVFLVVL